MQKDYVVFFHFDYSLIWDRAWNCGLTESNSYVSNVAIKLKSVML